ncbi:MAG: hypothetical protein KY433_06220, partial [Actinobacteria bacterium]|nr:hypothetical protein [Actinomycetota bacterium]
MKVAYWPGCVSRGFTPELHGSMARIAPLLDIELVELDRASCCGAGVIAEHNPELADTLNARTFALAQQAEGTALMMNICSTCQGSQSECQERLDASAEYRARINASLADEGLTYEKGLTNKNLLWLLVEELGLDVLRERVRRPLTDLRVGPFYGCYIVRPDDRLGIDDDHPRETYLAQVRKVLLDERLEVVDNNDWLAPMQMADVLRLTSRMTVAQMLERADFAARYQQRRPIAVSEFLYPLLQGQDSVAV